MDIEKLCPGCMRELGAAQDAGPQKKPMQGTGIGGAQGTGDNGDGERKCPYCGFNAVTYRQNSRCLPLYTILAGKYLVGAVLGEGGFGITYIGYDLNMQTRIAIKEYFPVELVSRDTTSMTGDRVISMSGDKSATYRQGLKKYVTEAQNVSQFSEIPGVVSVKDFFYENETAYIVMEYIDGISLKDYLKERGGRLSEEESLAIMKPVLEALVKVHEAGIVHRDISPDNIMLTFQSAWDNGNIREDGNATGHGGATGHGNAAGCGTVTGYGAAAQRGVFTENTNADRLAPSGPTAAGKESAAVRTAHGESRASDMAAKEDGAVSDIASVKLIDFGAARMTAKNDQKSLTIILKHGYAPEEQYRTHGEQGPWTDVYAVCAVLYRMLTGQTPVPAMDRMFQDELKSFDDLNTKVSRNTQAAILKGLAVKKEDRIQTIRELMKTLYEGKAIRRNPGRIPLLAVGICSGCLMLTALAGTAFLLLSRPQEHSQENARRDVREDASTEPPSLAAENPGEDLASDSSEPGAIPPETETIVEFEPEELGEAVAFPDAQTSLSSSGYHVLFVMPDGSVKARGANAYGQCRVGDWSDIVAVSVGSRHSLGLRSDGKVFAAGRNEYGECDVDAWENVVQIAAGGNYVSYGLTTEGKVLACGQNAGDHFSDAAEWEDIVAITSTDWGGVIGLDREGTIHYAGSVERAGEDGSFQEIPFDEEYLSVTGWTGVKHLLLYSEDILLGLKEDGSVVSACIKEGATPYATIPVETWQGIEQLCADWPVIGVKKDGTFAYGDTENLEVIEAQRAMSGWEQVQAVGAVSGADFVVGLQKDGTILEYRKESGNTDIEAMDNLEWIHVLESVDGDCLVALDRDGQILTCGSAGVYLTPLEELNRDGEISGDMLAGFAGEDAVLLKDGRACFYRDWGSGGAWMGNGEDYVGEHIAQALDLHRSYQRHLYAFLLEDGHVEIRLAGPDLDEEWLTAEMEMERQRQEISGAESWEGIVQIAGEAWWGLYGLHQDGTVSYAGARETKRLEDYQGIVRLAGREGDVLGVKSDGTVEVIESSEYAVIFGRTQVSAWTGIKDVSMGESHVVGLKEDGTVIAAGSNHEGQCDVEDWTDIVYLTTGRNCTLGITNDGQLKMAGNLY